MSHGNFASVRESLQAVVPAADAYNTVISVTHNLGEFPRATSVSASYKWYRLASLSFRYEVDFNMYPAGSTAPTVPQFYWHMDRNADNVSIDDLGGMLSLGCKPQKYTKNIKVAYKPNILQQLTFAINTSSSIPGGGAGVSTYTPTFNKWLPTTFTTTTGGANQVAYMGHILYIDWPPAMAVAFPDLRVITTAVWQFKEPWEVEQAPTVEEAKTLLPAPAPAKRPREEAPSPEKPYHVYDKGN